MVSQGGQSADTSPRTGPRWLLLVHQLPTRPSNARVKTWRRLQQIGAVPLRGSGHVLPNSTQAREDFEWLKAEILTMGGQAMVFIADAIDTRSDKEIVESCRAARESDYRVLIKKLAGIGRRTRGTSRHGARSRSPFAGRTIRALRDRLSEIVAIDFFTAPARREAEAALASAEGRMRGPRTPDERAAIQPADVKQYRNRTWVTRPGPGVDRMASAWLIRTFVDPGAVFTFGEKAANHVPFDMYEGEFSHHGGLCTFEVMAEKFHISDLPIRRIGEIVHDLDLKDGRFRPPEAATVGALVDGLRSLDAEDETKLQRGMELFNALYLSMSIKSNE